MDMTSNDFSLAHTVAILTSTPQTVAAILRLLPDALLHVREGDGTWTPLQVLGVRVLGMDVPFRVVSAPEEPPQPRRSINQQVWPRSWRTRARGSWSDFEAP